MSSRVSLVVGLVLLGACHEPSPVRAPTPVLAIPPTSTGAAPKGAAESEEEKLAERMRLLALLDRGDLRAARAELERLPGRATRALLAATPNPLTHAKVVTFGPLPVPAQLGAKAKPIAVTREKGTREEAMAARRLGDADEHARELPFAPKSYAGRERTLVRATGGAYVVGYGGGLVALLERDKEPTVLDLRAWSADAKGRGIRVLGAALGARALFLVVSPGPDDLPFLVALDRASAAVRWRSVPAAWDEQLVVAEDVLVTWMRGTTGELVTLDAETGARRGVRATPEIVSGGPVLSVRAGRVELRASSQVMGNPRALRYEERLVTKLAAEDPPSEAPSATRRALPPSPPCPAPDRRAEIWRDLDGEGDGRAELVALRAVLASCPTNLVANALVTTATEALAASRARAGEALAARKPVVPPEAPATGRAPAPRPAPRTFAVTATKPGGFGACFAELPFPDDLDVMPGFVPEKIGGRGIYPEALVTRGRRVERYIRHFEGKTLVVGWGEGEREPVAFLELAGDVRQADVVGDAFFGVVLDHGGYRVEARDARTGALAWTHPGVVDAPFVVSRGYVLVSATNGDVLVLEGDTGRLAQTLVMPKTAGPGMGIGTYLVEDGDVVRALDGAQCATIGAR